MPGPRAGARRASFDASGQLASLAERRAPAMNLPSRYGSSEYSALAEELFAAFLRRRAAGEELDFEAYCAEHPEQADELDGLHADWDNLHGLLGRMGGLRELSPTAAPAALPRVEGAAQGSAPSRTSARVALLVLVLLGISASAASLGLVARREAQAAELLAEHNRRLEGEVFELDGRLIGLEASQQEAAARADESERRSAELAAQAEEQARRADAEADRAAAALALAEAQAQRAAEQERLAEERAQAAELVAQRAAEQARIAEEQARRAQEQGERAEALEQQARSDRRRAAAALVGLAGARLDRGDGSGARRALAGVDPERRGFAWRHLDARALDAARELEEHESLELLPRPSLPGALDPREIGLRLTGASLGALDSSSAESLPGSPRVLAAGTSEDGSVLLVALSDGRTLAFALSVGANGALELPQEPVAGLELQRGLPEPVGLALAGGGRRLLAVGRDGFLRAYDLEGAGELWRAAGVGACTPLVSPAGWVAARLGAHAVGAWRLSDGAFLGALGRQGSVPASYAWTAQGELALTFTDGRTWVGAPGAGAAPFELPARELDRLGPLGGKRSEPSAAVGENPWAESPCGEVRAEIGAGVLVLRDLPSGAPLLEFALAAPLDSLAFSADGRHLLARDRAGRGLVWSSAPSAVRALWSGEGSRSPD